MESVLTETDRAFFQTQGYPIFRQKPCRSAATPEYEAFGASTRAILAK